MARQLKYGRVERERRWLLSAVPELSWDRVYAIEDHYLRGSRMRLRRMVNEATGEADFKLARKLPPSAPGVGVMGNLYLDEGEYRMLLRLPSHPLSKRRHYLGDWGVDLFDGGLILAEIEDDDPTSLAAREPPFPVVREVTAESAFTGAVLAAAGVEGRGPEAWAGLSERKEPHRF